jgi:hypothetical protein
MKHLSVGAAEITTSKTGKAVEKSQQSLLLFSQEAYALRIAAPKIIKVHFGVTDKAFA